MVKKDKAYEARTGMHESELNMGTAIYGPEHLIIHTIIYRPQIIHILVVTQLCVLSFYV